MKYIIDRIEGKYAVCESEDKSMVDITLELLPSGVKEGDAIGFEDGVYIKISKDKDRANRILKLMDELWK